MIVDAFVLCYQLVCLGHLVPTYRVKLLALLCYYLVRFQLLISIPTNDLAPLLLVEVHSRLCLATISKSKNNGYYDYDNED